ncbi:DUF1344 domain-containing protein [Devosia algicola]|uniref:DUF1344 domain-containing protein n=1 Tax=Devosia algicola TaxID=3026418 RepID=A0ABY7YQV4_9HYPH|nr:DUF1344 domain-containing protein [Devosia algicola]WDR03708.1 DUF1344 domain-containing protein [Devosia algicola]
MKKIIIPAALAIAMGMSGVAFAASTTATSAPQTITDTVKSFDLTAKTITLGNGIVYSLPDNFKDPGLKVGSKVSVKWEMNGTTHKVDSISLS